MELISIGRKYNTDKVEHGFLPFYEDILKDKKSENLTIMEIGVFYGSSIKMWNEYLPNSTIYAADWWTGIQGNGHSFDFPKMFIHESKNYNRVKIVNLNQSDVDNLKQVCEEIKDVKFDMILDDASHNSRDQQITFIHMWKLVKPGGYFIIEDIHTSLDSKYYDVLEDKSNTTLNMLVNYLNTKKMKSLYGNLEDVDDEIEYVDVVCLDSNNNRTPDLSNFKSGTAIIKKKNF